MKNHLIRLTRGRALMLLPLIITLPMRAIPMVRLEAPTTVNVGEQFSVGVFVDGTQSPNELLAFGFNVGFPFSIISFTGYSVVAPFADDTPLLGGPFAGSAFPGLQGDNILIANLNLLAVSQGLATLHVSDQESEPFITGLFTTLNPDRHRINSYAEVNVVSVADQSSTLYLLALGLGALTFFSKRRRASVDQRNISRLGGYNDA